MEARSGTGSCLPVTGQSQLCLPCWPSTHPDYAFHPPSVSTSLRAPATRPTREQGGEGHACFHVHGHKHRRGAWNQEGLQGAGRRQHRGPWPRVSYSRTDCFCLQAAALGHQHPRVRFHSGNEKRQVDLCAWEEAKGLALSS